MKTKQTDKPRNNKDDTQAYIIHTDQKQRNPEGHGHAFPPAVGNGPLYEALRNCVQKDRKELSVYPED